MAQPLGLAQLLTPSCPLPCALSPDTKRTKDNIFSVGVPFRRTQPQRNPLRTTPRSTYGAGVREHCGDLGDVLGFSCTIRIARHDGSRYVDLLYIGQSDQYVRSAVPACRARPAKPGSSYRVVPDKRATLVRPRRARRSHVVSVSVIHVTDNEGACHHNGGRSGGRAVNKRRTDLCVNSEETEASTRWYRWLTHITAAAAGRLGRSFWCCDAVPGSHKAHER